LLAQAGSFFDHNGKCYCEQHFHAARGSLCASCQKPVVGRCITGAFCVMGIGFILAIGKRYHPEHFSCTFCKRQLGVGVTNTNAVTFKENEGKPYCIGCHIRLFD
jgi:paxillin